jgi:superfamily II DNA or RNA helicase
MGDYERFLERKRTAVEPSGLEGPFDLSEKLFPFQRDLTAWALRRGKSALWCDTGLGKTPMSLEWARIISERTNARVLILTPLAVAQQFALEGDKFGVPVNVCRDGAEVLDGINVTNYERIHRFDTDGFGAVVLDESSCLKDYTSKTRQHLTEAFAQTPYRLCLTATPAPNDYIELGTHAAFLGAMTREEMLAMFFVHDGGETQKWRLKGHARQDFWRWIASWAANVRKPSDLGYDDGAFALPPLNIQDHIVPINDEMVREAGLLFAVEVKKLAEQRAARRASLGGRVAVAAKLANESGEPWVMWCDLNAESEALTKSIDGAVEVRGSHNIDEKERRLRAFSNGETRVLVSKPSIAGHGMNWQHCANTAFVGLSHSWEAWYQAVRRFYRFGQSQPVNCHMISSDAEGAVAENLRRKQADAEQMASEMATYLVDVTRKNVCGTERRQTVYEPRKTMRVPAWLTTEET